MQRLFLEFTSSIGLSKQYRPILEWEAKSYFGVTEKKIPMTASPSGCWTASPKTNFATGCPKKNTLIKFSALDKLAALAPIKGSDWLDWSSAKYASGKEWACMWIIHRHKWRSGVLNTVTCFWVDMHLWWQNLVRWQYLTQALIVTGGVSPDPNNLAYGSSEWEGLDPASLSLRCCNSILLDTTEILLPGASAWVYAAYFLPIWYVYL